MKESLFRSSVLSKLPGRIHRQPILAGAYGTAGTPDTYIDHRRDLWVEWKVLPGEDYFPSELKVGSKYLPTTLQAAWLDRRHKNGGNAICIVGCKLRGKAHGFVLDTPKLWRGPVSRETFVPMMLSATELAKYIEERVS